MSIINYIKAGYPLLWIESFEEHRVLTAYTAELKRSAKQGGPQSPYDVYTWDVADGIRPVDIKDNLLAVGKPLTKKVDDQDVPRNGIMDPLNFMEKEVKENALIFLKDYHPFLSASFEQSPLIIRKIRNLIESFKASGKVLVILSPKTAIPDELEKEITVLRYALPNRDGLRVTLKAACESAGAPYPKEDETVIDAALGMTSMEAENSFSVSIVEKKGILDAATIRREKAAIVRKTDLLEVIETNESIDSIGGNEALKEWLINHKSSFGEEARNFGVTPPKGMLLVGVPGCGKSLSAKATAMVLDRTLLRFDVGKVFDKYQGESEAKLRRVLAMAESISPCILWIDELEKAFSGTGGGDSDGHGTTKRVFSDFLYWLEDRKADVFIVATGNNVTSLPEELIRPGRIDIIWWVDVPDDVQRIEIINIHLKKKNRSISLFDNKEIEKLVKLSAGFSGAGIERWVKAAIEHAFFTGKKEVSVLDFEATVTEVTPAAVNSDNMKKSRAWANENKCKLASKPHGEAEVKMEIAKTRKIDTGK